MDRKVRPFRPLLEYGLLPVNVIVPKLDNATTLHTVAFTLLAKATVPEGFTEGGLSTACQCDVAECHFCFSDVHSHQLPRKIHADAAGTTAACSRTCFLHMHPMETYSLWPIVTPPRRV